MESRYVDDENAVPVSDLSIKLSQASSKEASINR